MRLGPVFPIVRVHNYKEEGDRYVIRSLSCQLHAVQVVKFGDVENNFRWLKDEDQEKVILSNSQLVKVLDYMLHRVNASHKEEVYSYNDFEKDFTFEIRFKHKDIPFFFQFFIIKNELLKVLIKVYMLQE